MSVLIVCGGELAATAMAGVAGGNMKCEMFTFFSIYKNKDQPAYSLLIVSCKSSHIIMR